MVPVLTEMPGADVGELIVYIYIVDAELTLRYKEVLQHHVLLTP